MFNKLLQTKILKVLMTAGLACGCALAGNSKPAPAKPAAAPAPKPAAPAAKAATPAARQAAPGAAGRGTPGTTGTHVPTAPGHPSPTTGGNRPVTTGGIHPVPGGGAHTVPGGGSGRPPTVSHFPGRAPVGSQTVRARNGSEIRTRPNGSRADLHDPMRNMDVHRSLSGNRVVRVERPDHSRVVAERGGRGYVQRPYAFRGHEYARRTYYVNGRAYDRYYRPYAYRGVALEVYAPVRYYPAGYYGWAYNPWVAPAPYAWGFTASPWYGYYGGYFAPQPVYPSASYWLTDYMISNSLQNAYQAGVESGQRMQPMQAGLTPMTPDVKAQIAAEVQKQIALENQEAQITAQGADIKPESSGIERMMGDGASHVFVVSHDLDLVNNAGMECLVTPGDVLQLRAPQEAAGDMASLLVLASKGGQECGKSSTVSVALNDLQDMQNSMRETIDQGLGELQAKQGKGGLPAAPQTAAGAPVQAVFTQGAPPPEPNIATEIAQQALEADRSEAEAGDAPQTVPGGPSDSPAVVTKEVSLGMTQQQVTDILGPPKSIVNPSKLKQILIYPDMTFILESGKVTDIK